MLTQETAEKGEEYLCEEAWEHPQISLIRDGSIINTHLVTHPLHLGLGELDHVVGHMTKHRQVVGHQAGLLVVPQLFQEVRQLQAPTGRVNSDEDIAVLAQSLQDSRH